MSVRFENTTGDTPATAEDKARICKHVLNSSSSLPPEKAALFGFLFQKLVASEGQDRQSMQEQKSNWHLDESDASDLAQLIKEMGAGHIIRCQSRSRGCCPPTACYTIREFPLDPIAAVKASLAPIKDRLLANGAMACTIGSMTEENYYAQPGDTGIYFDVDTSVPFDEANGFPGVFRFGAPAVRTRTPVGDLRGFPIVDSPEKLDAQSVIFS